MKRVLGIVLIVIMNVTLIPVSFADAGEGMVVPDAQMQVLQQQQEKFEKQDVEINTLKTQIQQLVEQVTKLESENQKTREYAQSLETRLESKLIAAPVVTKPEQVVQGGMEGIQIGISTTGIVQGVLGGANQINTAGEKTDASWSNNITFSEDFGNGGRALVDVEMGHGQGLAGDNLTLLSNLNYDAAHANSRLELAELQYEHWFFEDHLGITAGRLDPAHHIDGNTIAANEKANFLANGFVHSAALPIPGYTLGGAVDYRITDDITLTSGVFEQDGDGEEVNDGLFLFVQSTYSTDQFMGLPGHYRIYGWYDTSDYTVFKDNSIDPSQKDDNFGFGMSCDQYIMKHVAAFTRCGWSRPRVSAIELAWSTGLQVDGILWHREADYCGFAIGQNIPGVQYEKGGNPNNIEGQLELYYNYQLFEYLRISPFFQMVWNPYGVDDETNSARSDTTVTVCGVRSQLDF